jgi:hypothetical protein
VVVPVGDDPATAEATGDAAVAALADAALGLLGSPS